MRKLINIFCYLAIINFLFSTFDVFGQITFVDISDLHVSNAVSYVNSCDNQAAAFQCYIKEFAAMSPKPAFVVASGDIANIGNSSPDGMYPELTQFLFPPSQTNPAPGSYFIDSAQSIPIYFTPGNHEYYTTLIPPLSNSTLQYYPHYISPDEDYTVETADAVLLFLRSGNDAFRPIWEDVNITCPEGSGITTAQCNWLRTVLNANPDKHKIIVMHHPPVNVAGTSSDGTPFTGTILDPADGSILNNRTTFLNICDSMHVDIVLAGHEHQNVVANRAGNVVDENWTGGTRYVQTGAAFNHSYRLVTIDAASVSVSTPMLSCTTTDIAETKDRSSLSVYPNPSTSMITIEAPMNSKLQIISMEGQCLRNITVDEPKTMVDVSGLPKGLYLVKVEMNEGSVIGKFVKE